MTDTKRSDALSVRACPTRSDALSEKAKRCAVGWQQVITTESTEGHRNGNTFGSPFCVVPCFPWLRIFLRLGRASEPMAQAYPDVHTEEDQEPKKAPNKANLQSTQTSSPQKVESGLTGPAGRKQSQSRDETEIQRREERPAAFRKKYEEGHKTKLGRKETPDTCLAGLRAERCSRYIGDHAVVRGNRITDSVPVTEVSSCKYTTERGRTRRSTTPALKGGAWRRADPT